MRPTGKTNPVTVLVILAVIAGGYWVVMFGPLYLDNLEVREAADSAFNVYVVERDETKAIREALNRQTKIGSHFEVSEEDGTEQKLPGLGLTEDDVVLEHDESSGEASVRIEYNRTVILWPTENRRTVHFAVEKKGKIKK